MKLSKRMVLDRKAMAELDRRGKLLFLWDYYKIPILAVICGLLLAVITAATTVSSGKTALYAVFVNTSSPEGDRELLDGLLEGGGIALEGRHIDITADLHLGWQLNEAEDAQAVQVLAALFGIRGLDFFAADQEVFEKYLSQGAFLDLSLFLEPELLERHREGLVYRVDENGQTSLGGIRLSGNSGLHRAGYYTGEVTVGVAANAQNMEEAVRFLKQLLQND